MGQRGKELIAHEIARIKIKGEAKDSIGEKRIHYERNFIWTVDMRCLYYLADRISPHPSCSIL